MKRRIASLGGDDMRLAILLALVLSGCVSDGPRRIDLPNLTSHDILVDRHVARAWPYAQIAYNVYHRELADPRIKPFRLPPRFYLRPADIHGNDEIGFAYDVLTEDIGEGRYNLVLAFRGTEGWSDWRFGNLSRAQQVRAASLATEIVQHIRRDSSNARRLHDIILVGHSLGGAIANHVSFRVPGAWVYAFDTSPVFSRPPNYKQTSTDIEYRRLSVTQHLEILKALRMPSPEATQIYLSLRCLKGLPIARHDMRAFAVCLTHRAECFADDKQARAEARWSMQQMSPSDRATVKKDCAPPSRPPASKPI
jgi:hypothetical protein